jgi:phospholipid/cholesterol/gamma-HCH transport system substrate-binding protein/paraquat-inducible protein B
MSAKARYFRVGVFIMSALAILIVGIVTLSGGKWFKNLESFESYFDESVQGLAVGSPIKIRGVQVGTVDSIMFVGDVYAHQMSEEALARYGRYVIVSMIATNLAPHLTEKEKEERRTSYVTAGLRIRLAQQGITGLVYVEADYMDPKEYPPLDVPWTPRTTYLPSAPSTVTVLGTALHNITRDLEKADIHKVTADVDILVLEATKSIKDANLALLSTQASQVLAESNRITHELSRLVESREVKTIISDAASVMHGMREVVADWSEISKQTKLASERFPETSSRLERIVRHLDMLLAKKAPDIEQTIDSLRLTADNLRELSENAKQYPAQIFLGGPPPRVGSAKR